MFYCLRALLASAADFRFLSVACLFRQLWYRYIASPRPPRLMCTTKALPPLQSGEKKKKKTRNSATYIYYYYYFCLHLLLEVAVTTPVLRRLSFFSFFFFNFFLFNCRVTTSVDVCFPLDFIFGKVAPPSSVICPSVSACSEPTLAAHSKHPCPRFLNCRSRAQDRIFFFLPERKQQS